MRLHGRYTFWIGSGISRGRVDGLDKLVTRVLSHLQQRIDHNLPGCQFKKALEEAMALADLSPTERALVDLRKGVDEWGPLDVVVSRLVKVYSAYRDSRWSST
jgi:hypothetical protein